MKSDSKRRHLYRILLPDGRSYIGVAKDPRARFSGHSGAPTRIGEAIRRYGRNACRLEILCVGSRDYILDLERHAIIAFNTRWPAGYNVDGGGMVPDPHPETIARQQASTARTRLRQRGEFRNDYGVRQSQYLNYRRLTSGRTGQRRMAADLPDLDNRTLAESDLGRPWQILSARYIDPSRTWESLARGARQRN
jgi:hypothetical protein